MPWHLVLLNTLSFFSIVIVYMALLDIAHTVPAFLGLFGLSGMNVWYMSATAAGILWFGCTWHSSSKETQRSLLLSALGGNAAGLVSLAAGSATTAGNVACLYAGSLLFPLTAGYIAGYLYFLISRRIPASRQGTCIGLFLALTNLLLFLLDNLTKVTGAPLLLPWSFLLPVLAVISWLLLRYDFSAATENVTENAEAKIAEPHPFVKKHLRLLLAMAVVLSLLVGFSDTLNFIRHEEYYANWHALSRLFIVAGSLLAGWLADFHPAYLPLAALLSKTAVMGFYAFALEGAPFAFMVCADVFFTSFTIVFLTWMFLYVAMHSPRPALWAGMGRAIEMPVSAFGTLLGLSLLNQFSVSVTLVVYAALLVFTGALFYRGLLLNNVMLQNSAGIVMPFPTGSVIPFPPADRTNSHAFSETKQNTEEDHENIVIVNDVEDNNSPAAVSGNDKNETNQAAVPLKPAVRSLNSKERIKQKYALTNRETEVLTALLQGNSITEIADEMYVTPRTVKYHISHILQKTGAKSQHELQYILQKEE